MDESSSPPQESSSSSSCCGCLQRLLVPLTKTSSVASVAPHEKEITHAMASIADAVICFDDSKSFSVATSNGVRSYNEDRHRVISNLEAYHRAVMNQVDGTTCGNAQHAIQIEYEAPVKRIINMLDFAPKNDPNRTRFFESDSFTNDLKQALDQTCNAINQELLNRSAAEKFDGGTTAVVVLLRENVAYISNIGDSRAILISRRGTCILSIDHKVTNVDEKKRIEDAGGVIVYVKGVPRVNGRLAIARALGDKELQQYVIAKPDILQHEIQPEDQYIVMASDGLWDTLSNDQVTSCIQNNPWLGPQELSQILLKRALENGSTDNITVMVVDIHQKKQ